MTPQPTVEMLILEHIRGYELRMAFNNTLMEIRALPEKRAAFRDPRPGGSR